MEEKTNNNVKKGKKGKKEGEERGKL